MTASPHYLDTVEARLAPSHTALLVVDMQNDFCAKDGYIEAVVGLDAAPCRAIAAPIMELVGEARRASVPIFWVKANYDHDKIPPGMLAKQRQRGEIVCCGSGSRGAEFFEVVPAPGEVVIEKHNYSAFRGTDLDTRLRARSIRTVVLAGVQTNICVETSLRDAVCIGFYAALVTDCTASHTLALHEATIKTTSFLFGDTLDRSALASIWRGDHLAAT